MVLGKVAGALSALGIALFLNFCVRFYNHRRRFKGLVRGTYDFVFRILIFSLASTASQLPMGPFEDHG
jgi:hypothetical protein